MADRLALLNLSSWCLAMVERLFLAVPRGCLRFVIVVFSDHTHLLFLEQIDRQEKFLHGIKKSDKNHSTCIMISFKLRFILNCTITSSTLCCIRNYITYQFVSYNGVSNNMLLALSCLCLFGDLKGFRISRFLKMYDIEISKPIG